MNLNYHPVARLEFLQAVEYSEIEFGTGESLRQRVEEVHELLLKFPEIGELEETSVRRYSLADFPYPLIYFCGGRAYPRGYKRSILQP